MLFNPVTRSRENSYTFPSNDLKYRPRSNRTNAKMSWNYIDDDNSTNSTNVWIGSLKNGKKYRISIIARIYLRERLRTSRVHTAHVARTQNKDILTQTQTMGIKRT